ncbi:Ionotropic receptor 75a [Anthophora quadrimaculata]
MILSDGRLNSANVLVQVMPLRTCFMFFTVPSVKIDMNVIFRPFARNVWYMFLLLTIIVVFTLWMIFKLGKDDIDTGTVLIIVAAISQQGFPFNSNQIASRLAFLQTMIFGLLLYNCYAGAIVSARLNTPLNKMNDSLYSIVDSKMKLGTSREKYLNVLMNSTLAEIQYFKRYWQAIPEKEKYYSVEDGIKAIMKPGFAYHTDPLKAYPLIERIFDNQMICRLNEVHWLRPSVLGVWSSRRSQFQEIAKIGLIRIITSGICKRELIRWRPRKPYCDKDQQYVSSVTIHEALPIILVLIFGIILSVIICFMEKIIFNVLRAKEKKGKQ